MKKRNNLKKLQKGFKTFLSYQYRRYKILLLIVLAVFIFFLFFGISRSFLAKGKEKDNLDLEFIAYNKNYSKMSVACGDINGDEEDEIVSVGSDTNSYFKFFDKKGENIDSFYFTFNKNEKDFAITLGDVDGDKKEEIIVVPKIDSSLIKIFKGKKIISEFEAFNGLKIGASIASGDINYDGRDEIIVGAGKGGGPQIKVFDINGKELASFFAFYPLLRNGINVVTANIDKDEQDEIIVSEKVGGQGLIKIYKFDNVKTSLSVFLAYPPKTLSVGANVETGDLNNDGRAEIITMKDTNDRSPEIKIFDSKGNLLKIKNNILSSFKENINLDVCNFKDKKALMISSQEGNDSKIKLLMNVEFNN